MNWKPCPGWEAYYEVSDTGEIRKLSGALVGQWLHDGYMLARLSNPRAVVRVHRLVAEAFVPNPDKKPFVNHIDCTPSNNRSVNLEWCTQKENLQHARNLGRMPDNFWEGKPSPNRGISMETARQIRSTHAAGGFSHSQLAGMFHTSKRTVGRIVNNETYIEEPRNV